MMGQLDENYDKTVFSTADPSYEKTIAQVYYMHNVMPTVNGYQSIGYDTVANPYSGSVGSNPFDQAFTLQTAAGNKFIFTPAGGKNYIYSGSTASWVSTSPFAPGTVPNNVQVSTAFVQGETYIYYANYGCFKYNETLGTLTSVTLTSLVPTNIIGICAANGYMMAYTKTDIAWSSLVDPTDFTPSLATGAGGGKINEAKGYITTCLAISGGFILYCEKNAVGATYTGNSSVPYIFKEVAGSGGLTSSDKVSWTANLIVQYALTNRGIQEVSKTASNLVHEGAADFIAGKIFEDFDDTTLTMTTSYPAASLAAKIVVIEARYLVISYGLTAATYTHALVYDIELKRWGKLKISHVACFEWNEPNIFGNKVYGDLTTTTYGDLATTTYFQFATQSTSVVLPKKTMAFLQADGTVKVVNFDISEVTANGVLLLGKFQFRRNTRIEHQKGTIDTVGKANNFSYYIVPSYDGKTLQPAVSGFPRVISDKTRQYGTQVSGINISLLMVGQFNLSSVLLSFTSGGFK